MSLSSEIDPVASIDSIRDAASIEGLKHTFARSLTVADLASSLISLDENQPAAAGLDLMQSTGQPVLGVRRAGRICGWVSQKSLTGGGSLSDHIHDFDSDEVIAESTSIQDVLAAMVDREQLFIRWLGEIVGVVHRSDLQKPPVRMWLFGVVTLVDSNFTWAIERLYPGESWFTLLSEGRLQKAQGLQAERLRRGSHCRLIDCLQIKDKADILLKKQTHLQLMGFSSRREAEHLGRDIELLRNHLAHGQELESSHLGTARLLAASLDHILRADGAMLLLQEAQSSTALPTPPLP
jgi:CBS domain-containing protein